MWHTLGAGGERIYPDSRTKRSDFGHPPRPLPGSAADFDRILAHCDGDRGHVRWLPRSSSPLPCVSERRVLVHSRLSRVPEARR